MDLQQVIRFDRFSQKGNIFVSKDQLYKIQYPDEGNDTCFSIEENSFWFRHRNKIIGAAIHAHVTPGSLFFDIGGGNGYVSTYLKQQGYEPVLFEPGPGVFNADKRSLPWIFQSFFDAKSIKENSVESAGLFDVLEHIPDDGAFLQEIYSLFAENGRLFITVPAYKFLWSQEDVDAGHQRRYTRRQLEETLRQSGFEIVYSTYFFFPLPIPIFLMRKLFSSLKERNDNKDIQKAHILPKFISVFVDKLLSSEVRMVRKQKSIPHGGSLFIEVQKTNIIM